MAMAWLGSALAAEDTGATPASNTSAAAIPRAVEKSLANIRPSRFIQNKFTDNGRATLHI